MFKISIIIVTWNSQEYITDCLNSILKNQTIRKQIFVVDNNSTDKTVQIIKKNFPNIELIENNKNNGFTFACNQGIEKSSGKYVLLLNPDTILTPHSLDKLIAFMERQDNVGAVGPQLLNMDGTIQPSCRSFPSQKIYLWEFTGLSRLFPEHPRFSSWKMGYFSHDKTAPVDQPMGACLLIRKRAIDQVGQLDNNFFMFYSEVDLCYRLKQAGWDIYFYPEAKVYHYQGASVKKIRKRMIVSTHKSAIDFLRKHQIGSKITLPIILFLITLSAYIRIIKQYIH